MKKLDKEREELLEKLDNAETDEEINEIALQLLEKDADCPYGKLALWETLAEDEGLENLGMLREALETMRAVVEARETPAFIEDDRDSQVYCTILMNLGYALLASGEAEEALAAAHELAKFDDEGFYPSRTLLYRAMLDLEMYGDILETLESDELESVVGEYARAIAMIETECDPAEVREAITYAISLSPDVPFFVLNIWDFPGDEEEIDEDLEEILHYAAYIAEPWCSSDKRLAAISGPAFLLGYLTDRLDDDKEMAVLREGYESAGVLEKVEAAKAKLTKMAEDGMDLEEIDAEALNFSEEILNELLG